MNFEDEIQNCFLKHSIELTTEQIEKFKKYYTLLIEWNQKFNLTTITSQTDVIEKHFLDSVIGAYEIPQNAKVLDIGSGAGFPSLPLKILRNDIDVTLIDSVNKKITFLDEVINKLDLTNARAIHTRAEDFASKKENRESFDICLSRAVASLNTLCEYSLPFVKLGGKFLAYKSSNIEEELENAKNAIMLLGGKTKEVIHKKVQNVDRVILKIQKIKTTPSKFPRGKNKPRLMPL